MALQPNHVTALVGAALLLVAGIGVAIVEEPGQTAPSTGKKFHVSFPVSESSTGQTGQTADAQTNEVSIPLDVYNLTIAVMAVTWTDNPPLFAQAAMVTVQVEDPAGNQAGSGQGTASPILIPLGGFNEPPEEFNITASSEEKAWDRVLDDYPLTENGTGAWKVTISVQRSGFGSIFRRGSVSWDVEIGYGYYSAQLEEVQKE